ncbi:hypothetical protein ABPG75_000412 [Micractinium tetrahymenae]
MLARGETADPLDSPGLPPAARPFFAAPCCVSFVLGTLAMAAASAGKLTMVLQFWLAALAAAAGCVLAACAFRAATPPAASLTVSGQPATMAAAGAAGAVPGAPPAAHAILAAGASLLCLYLAYTAAVALGLPTCGWLACLASSRTPAAASEITVMMALEIVLHVWLVLRALAAAWDWLAWAPRAWSAASSQPGR